MFEAAWGLTSMVKAGTLGVYPTRAQAEARVEEFLSDHENNPPVGAWVEVLPDENSDRVVQGER